jgi:hypothetical protein
MFRKFRTTGRADGLRVSTRRRDGSVQHPTTLVVRDRYSAALAAGWGPRG